MEEHGTLNGDGGDGADDNKEKYGADVVNNLKLSKNQKMTGSAADIETTRIQTIIEVFDDELLSSDSDKSFPMRPSYLDQASLHISDDFFDKLGSIPNLSIIEDKSAKHSMKSRQSEKSPRHTEEEEDVGLFVDPLTGSIITKFEEAEEEDAEEEGTEHEEESSSDIEISEDDELLQLLKTDQEVEAPKPLDDTQVFETFMEMEKANIIDEVVEFDWAAYEREREFQKLTAVTHQFLRELIKEVVEKCEYIDPKIVLRDKLDKATLIEDIADKLEELEIEQKIRSFLNRRISEYYYRKGQYRVFAEDSPETLVHDMNRYKTLTKNLDQMLAREEEIKQNSQQQIASLEQTKSMLNIRNEEKLGEFEQLVKKTFGYQGERLPIIVDALLRSMTKLRDEISAVRYVLIQKQHTNATLTEQLISLEDLGNNLRMHDYECLQTEVQALHKKIEERNADLSKSRIRCNSNIHTMGHLKEKQAMLRNKVKIQKIALSNVLEQKQLARESVLKAKRQRKKLRADIQELSYQCGLLDKPALMLDYDVTMEQVTQATIRVEALRNKHDDILRKIAKFVGKCL